VDIARLSPLVFEHINVLGRYAFSLPEAVKSRRTATITELRNASDAFEESFDIFLMLLFCSIAPQYPSAGERQGFWSKIP
jgi:hypothetical protein